MINSRLDGLAPVPRNITKERTPPPSMMSVLSPLLYGPMYLISAGIRGISSVGGNIFFSKKSNFTESISNSNSTSNGTTNVGEVEVGLADTDTCDASTHIDGTCSSTSSPLTPDEEVMESSKQLPLGAINNTKKDVKWSWGRKINKKEPDTVRISESDWSHMTPYIEPRHLSVHSSQIPEVSVLEKS